MTSIDSIQNYLMIQTTEKDLAKAHFLMNTILESRLAACISCHEVSSSYWWEGQIESVREVKIVIKSMFCHLCELKKIIKSNHSYEIPEITYWQFSSTKDYSEWLKASIISL